MRSFNDLVSDFTILSSDSSSANNTFGETRINAYVKKILAMRDWTFNRSSATDLTVASQQNYPLPYNCGKVLGLKITNSSTDYWTTEEKSRDTWTVLNRVTKTSDVPRKYFIEPHQILIYPIPASDDLTITIYYQKILKDFSPDNYSTGTITASISTTAVVGTSTVWTSAMVGRYIQPGGDEYWYEIESVTNATNLVIRRNIGTAVSAGTYKISEMIPFPYGYEDTPLYGALWDYYDTKETALGIRLAQDYKEKYVNGIDELVLRDSKGEIGLVEQDDVFQHLVDVNRHPLDLTE